MRKTHSRRLLLGAGVIAALAACTRQEPRSPVATATPQPSTSTPSGTPTPDLDIEGADPAAREAVRALYAGKVSGTVQVRSGEWKKEKVAVATFGDDVTLMVEGATGWTVVGGWWPSIGRARTLDARPRMVLAIGSDARPGEAVEKCRGDALQIIGVDDQGAGGILGLARDLLTTLPGGQQGKVNAALAFAGAAGELATVRQLTGLPIDGYVVTGFEGFTGVIDRFGGLPFTVVSTLSEGGYTLRQGAHTLTGRDALFFARRRKILPDGDFGRSRHQGDLVGAAIARFRSQGALSIPATLTLASPFVASDLNARAMLTFAAQLLRTSPDRLGRHVAKGGFGWTPDGQSVVLLDEESRAAFARFKSGRL